MKNIDEPSKFYAKWKTRLKGHTYMIQFIIYVIFR